MKYLLGIYPIPGTVLVFYIHYAICFLQQHFTITSIIINISF